MINLIYLKICLVVLSFFISLINSDVKPKSSYTIRPSHVDSLIKIEEPKLQSNSVLYLDTFIARQEHEWHDFPYTIGLVYPIPTYNTNPYIIHKPNSTLSIRYTNTTCALRFKSEDELFGACMGEQGLATCQLNFVSGLFLSKPSVQGVWKLQFKLLGSGPDHTNIIGRYKLQITGDDIVRNYDFDLDNQQKSFSIPDMPPGIYQLTLTAPKVRIGCWGGRYHGGVVTTKMDLDIFLR